MFFNGNDAFCVHYEQVVTDGVLLWRAIPVNRGAEEVHLLFLF